MIFDKFSAFVSLCPTSSFEINGDGTVNWLDNTTEMPTDSAVTAEIQRLQAEYDSKEYQRSRSAEYPPITDYLDGVVKGDQAQIDQYIADCQAVKAKYPKGS